MSALLIVDDDQVFARSLVALARREGHSAQIASSLAAAQRCLSDDRFDLVVLDLDLPDGSGIELLNQIDATSATRVVIVTAHPTLDSAMRVANSPWAGYLTKPVPPESWRELMLALGRPVAAQSHLLLGDSPAIRQVLALLERVGPTDASVLITGESGTGKDLAAQLLHEVSNRTGRFVALNCGAVAPELLASQLFGHERGSFTGALGRHAGVFEQAADGTLFLDEITEMSAHLQVFLLRVLETGSFVRVGGTETIGSSARIVAATNRDPIAAIEEGRLRKDLYYRLAGIRVDMPSLRDRGDDVIVLANMFVARLNERYGGAKHLDPASLHALRGHSWPGNVRELRSDVQQAYLLQDGPALRVVPQPEPAIGAASRPERRMVFEIGTPMETVKREVLLRTLEHCGNDKTATARALGISVRTVHNELARSRGKS